MSLAQAAGSAALQAVAPLGVVAAAQPYQTTAGPALTVNFQHDPQLFPFQARPFMNSGAVSVYQSVLLHSLAEFCETARPTRHHVSSVMASPMKDFWRRVGTLNTTYSTTSSIGCIQHPSVGSAELVQSGHRKNLDVRLSLYGPNEKCLAFMVMSGPRETAHQPMPLVDAAAAARLAEEEYRHPTANLPSVVVPDGWIDGVVVGDVRPTASSRGFAARLHCATDDGGPVAPWNLQDAIATFASKVRAASSGPNSMPPVDTSTLWPCVAYNCVNNGDVASGSDAEIVCAEPKYFPSYWMPPWKHEVGCPQLAGQPCLALRVEVRQFCRAVVIGTYFFSPVGKPR